MITVQQDNLPMSPVGKVAVLMRIDTRIDMLMLSDMEGNARVIRNLGGRVADALLSLTASGQMLDVTHLMVIHHMDCDMPPFSGGDSCVKLKREFNAETSTIDTLRSSDLEQSIRDDIAFLSASPLIPKNIEISGFIYDIRSRKLSPVT